MLINSKHTDLRDVPDDLWERVDPLLETFKRKRSGGSPPLSRRKVLAGILYKCKKHNPFLMNIFLKWLFYCICLPALPIGVRALLHIMPGGEKITLFEISDILFYGIAIHFSLAYEMLEFVDHWATTILRIVSLVAVIAYLVCGASIVINKTAYDDCKFLVIFIGLSFLFCAISGTLGKSLLQKKIEK